MKELKNFKSHYLAAAYKLAMALLKHPESAAEMCQLSTKKMISDLEVDNDVDTNFFMSEYSYFCDRMWQDVTGLIEFYLETLDNSNIKINVKLNKNKYVTQANKVFTYVLANRKYESNQFSDKAATLLGEIHYQTHVKQLM
tara:strand:+ start:6668 stop:7090 length:423 start_codon:yes stop_codon:yes gene_type:complete